MPLPYPNHIHELEQRLSTIEQALQYGFHEKKWLIQAFTHRSYLNEQRLQNLQSNERLEFLGDAVLNALVGRFLFDRFPEMDEGQLSQLRSQIVDASTCTEHVIRLGLETSLLMGKGQRMGAHLSSLLADLFEAILGAIYIDGGWSAAERFLWSHFSDPIITICENPQRNWKADLQDLAQKRLQMTPTYKVLREEGPDHTKAFDVGVFIGSYLLATATGNSKKSAQQAAAHKALLQLEASPELWQRIAIDNPGSML